MIAILRLGYRLIFFKKSKVAPLTHIRLQRKVFFWECFLFQRFYYLFGQIILLLCKQEKPEL